MNRRTFVRSTVASLAIGSAIDPACSPRGERPAETPRANLSTEREFELEEATIRSLQDAMVSGKHTARSVTDLYLKRIDDTNHKGPKLGAVIETNPDATQIADQLDAERRARGPRGPLHGIPILIKDNIDTADKMLTTDGSPALEGSQPSRDSNVVERLRQAGAVILGKTNLIEFAGFRGTPPFSWSTRGGLCRNPYALDRSPLGSSSGSAVGASANLAAASLGTETHGSIMLPSAFTGVVGIKPTVGLVSRAGIIPIAQTHDTAGPIARTVTDAAIVLSALAGSDPRDPATAADHRFDYSQALDADALRGARIGVPRAFFGSDSRVTEIVDRVIETMKQKGAVIVPVPDDRFSPHRLEAAFPDYFTALKYEMKDGLNRYLQDRGPKAPIKSLQDVIEFNERNRGQALRLMNQDLLIASQAKGPLESDEYKKSLAAVWKLTRNEGLDAVVRAHKVDCLIGPTLPVVAPVSDPIDGDSLPDSLPLLSAAAMAGYPSVSLPVGFLFGLPLGLCLVGPAWSEPTLIKLAYAIEQATKARTQPRFLPTADLGV
jgi:amidase